MYRWTDEKLKNVFNNRQRARRDRTVSQWLDGLLDNVVRPRQTKLTKVQQAWQELLPPELTSHSCPDSLRLGRLRVLVDSSAHLQELDWLVREDLVGQLKKKCPGVTINEIKLVRGLI